MGIVPPFSGSPPEPPSGPQAIGPDDSEPSGETITIAMDQATATKLKLGNLGRVGKLLGLNLPIPLSTLQLQYMRLAMQPSFDGGLPDRSNAFTADGMILPIIAALPELCRDSTQLNFERIEKILADSLYWGHWLMEPPHLSVNRGIAAIYTISQTRARLDDFGGVANDDKTALHKVLHRLMLHTLKALAEEDSLTQGNEIQELKDRLTPIAGLNKYIAQLVSQSEHETNEELTYFNMEPAGDKLDNPEEDYQPERLGQFKSMISPLEEAVSVAKIANEALWDDPINNLSATVQGKDTVLINTGFLHDGYSMVEENDAGVTLIELLKKLKDLGYGCFVLNYGFLDQSMKGLAELAKVSKSKMQTNFGQFLGNEAIDDFANFLRLDDKWKQDHLATFYVSFLNFMRDLHRAGLNPIFSDNKSELKGNLQGLDGKKTVFLNLAKLCEGERFTIDHSLVVNPYALGACRESFMDGRQIDSAARLRANLIQAKATDAKSFGDHNDAVGLEAAGLNNALRDAGIDFLWDVNSEPDLIITNVSRPDNGGGSFAASGVPGGSRYVAS